MRAYQFNTQQRDERKKGTECQTPLPLSIQTLRENFVCSIRRSCSNVFELFDKVCTMRCDKLLCVTLGSFHHVFFSFHISYFICLSICAFCLSRYNNMCTMNVKYKRQIEFVLNRKYIKSLASARLCYSLLINAKRFKRNTYEKWSVVFFESRYSRMKSTPTYGQFEMKFAFRVNVWFMCAFVW